MNFNFAPQVPFLRPKSQSGMKAIARELLFGISELLKFLVLSASLVTFTVLLYAFFGVAI